MSERTPDFTQDSPKPTEPPATDYELGPADEPRIYVASLSDYNAGTLYGIWMQANQDPEQLQALTDVMLAASHEPGAEEWAIHDYDNFGAIRLGEYDSFATVSHLATGLRTYGPAFGAFVNLRETPEATYTAFEAAYAGEWKDVEDYVDELIDREGLEEQLISVVPPGLTGYVNIDVAGLARDLQLGGAIDVVESPGGVYVFTHADD